MDRVWPHDTAIAALGMARYGFHEHSATILTALLDAACATPNRRLPELFCGFARSDFEAPYRIQWRVHPKLGRPERR